MRHSWHVLFLVKSYIMIFKMHTFLTFILIQIISLNWNLGMRKYFVVTYQITTWLVFGNCFSYQFWYGHLTFFFFSFQSLESTRRMLQLVEEVWKRSHLNPSKSPTPNEVTQTYRSQPDLFLSPSPHNIIFAENPIITRFVVKIH